MIDGWKTHALKEVERTEDGRKVAVCRCGWRSLPTSDPHRSVNDHQRRIIGIR